MVDGEAVAFNVGGVTVIENAFCCFVPSTVANTVSVPDRVNGRRQMRVPASGAVQFP